MSMRRSNSIPFGLDEPAGCPGSPVWSPASPVRALLSVAPKIIWPIHDPAIPAMSPVIIGLRCNQEDGVAGVDWAVEGGVAACGGGVAGLAVVDCSIGLALFC